jgi:hypothetical protein
MLFLISSVVLHAQPLVGLQSPWNVIGSGGEIGSSGANTQLSSTLGQPAIGPMKNAAVQIHLGFWYPTGKTSSVATTPVASSSFELKQNFPNPFSSSTTIGFTVAQRSRVRLRVYNMLGEQVKVLANEILEPGYREVIWDGLTEKNEQASSGDYVCELEAMPLDGGATTGFSQVVRQKQIMHLLK